MRGEEPRGRGPLLHCSRRCGPAGLWVVLPCPGKGRAQRAHGAPSCPSPADHMELTRPSHALGLSLSRQYINGTMLDDRPIRVDFDWGFVEGRQFGRGRSGGQVRQTGAHWGGRLASGSSAPVDTAVTCCTSICLAAAPRGTRHLHKSPLPPVDLLPNALQSSPPPRPRRSPPAGAR